MRSFTEFILSETKDLAQNDIKESMQSKQLRGKFLEFFEKKRHTIVPSSSLIPNDQSVLFTTAGMQQFAPYLSGQAKPPFKRACSVQKCFRVNDLEQVGDADHHTFFEMLGNWSFGDSARHASRSDAGGYFKKEAIDFALEFLTKECGVSQEKLWITVFRGEKGISKDKEAITLWIKAGIAKEKIFEFGMKENFWGPTAAVGPCGPCSELHYDRTGNPCAKGKKCGPNCGCGRFVEFWNLVFMEYFKNKQGEFQPLPNKNIDTGVGFERLVAILQNKPSAYETDLFKGIISSVIASETAEGGTPFVIARSEATKQSRWSEPEASDLSVCHCERPKGAWQSRGSGSDPRSEVPSVILSEAKNPAENSRCGYSTGSFGFRPQDDRLVRIFADHIRAICFLVSDGVLPSNVEQGYVLRRLIRRLIGQGKLLNLKKNFLIPLAKKVVSEYSAVYPELNKKENDILTILEKEEEKFGKTIENGIKEFEKIKSGGQQKISGAEAFDLFSTYGLPLDMLKDLASKENVKIDEKGFEEQRQKHQRLSRAGAEKKFGGHGLGETRVFSPEDEEKVKKLHTATHLLHQALQDVLGGEARQMGSDITPERLRFDFSYSQKMTAEQIKEVEEIVNQKIKEDLEIKCEEMGKDEALKSGAKAFFKAKYGDKVTVYSIGPLTGLGPSTGSGCYSKEICAGPHAEKTGVLGHFRIKKEESSSAGVRRIKAALE